MKLADLQAAYRGYLLTGAAAALAPAIVADSFDGAERLAIYRNNFLLSLGEALKANFPVTLQLLGRDFFEQAARRFVLERPPRRPCLFEYGEEFPDYLRALPQLAAMPYVAQMARFELARIAASNAPAEEYVSADTLAHLRPEQLEKLSVRRASHAQIVAVHAPIVELWEAHQKLEPDLSSIDMTARRRSLLVCRPERTLVVQELNGPVARFLAAADSGTQLGHAAARAGAENDAALGRVIALSLELRLLAMAVTP